MFWTRVKQLIKAAGMNQEKFAAYIDIPLGTFQGWIHHNRLPEAKTACDIASALGVTVEYLVRGKDRDLANIRLRELAARKAAERIEKLLRQIEREIKLIKAPVKTRRKHNHG